VADGAGLAGDAAALDGADDVEGSGGLGQLKRLTDQKLQGLKPK
jgi:hypothetical protein